MGGIDLQFTVVLIVYLAAMIYLGMRGYAKTKNSTDYLLAGRKTHPVVLALSYGSSFISTSALVGFGGIAAMWGLSLFWLVFLNIFVGIFIAFVVFGKRTRRFGHLLQAHTFPELLGRRYKSKFLQVFGGLFIFIFMPLYAAAVLIGGSHLLAMIFNMDYNHAVMIYAIFVSMYVFVGGIKGVMYTDALQGGIMIFGALFLFFYTLHIVGGIGPALMQLNSPEMVSMVPEKLSKMGFVNWTSLPKMGSALWWIIFSSLTFGVGIGVLVQPQLVVRFMMVKSSKELHRSLILGGIFMLVLVGCGTYFVGTISNVYFFNEFGTLAMLKVDNFDKIIPFFIDNAMPKWFTLVFMLTILSAAMSTLSSQFHAIGTAIGRDFYEQTLGQKKTGDTILFTRIGIILALIVTVVLAYELPGSIVARATAVFFGLCTATFLPAYSATIFWKRTTRKAVIASCLSGFCTMAMLFIFVYGKTSAAFGVTKLIFGKQLTSFPYNVIDPLVWALPISAIVLIVVTLCTEDEVPEITKILFNGKK